MSTDDLAHFRRQLLMGVPIGLSVAAGWLALVHGASLHLGDSPLLWAGIWSFIGALLVLIGSVTAHRTYCRRSRPTAATRTD